MENLVVLTSLTSTLAHHPALFLVTTGLFSLMVGSFLNVVIFRLPKMLHHTWQTQSLDYLETHAPKYLTPTPPLKENATHTHTHTHTPSTPLNLITPRSQCTHCKTPIKWWQNIPLLSYLFLRGKCHTCQKKIAWQYPIIEFATCLFSIMVAWHFGPTWTTLFALIITWALIALTMIDFAHQLLPDDIVLPMLWLGLLVNLFGLFTSLQDAIIGAIIGYGSLYVLYHAYKLVTKKEGMGYGDFKLLGMLGAWFGWQAIPLIILCSSLVGALVGICLILFTKHPRETPIPFGPYLAIAGWATLLWGDKITQKYFLMIGLY